MTDPILTRREREVIDLIAQGLTHREAAASLGISRKAVDNRLRSARARYCAVNTNHLIAMIYSKDTQKPLIS
jgi:DNA-binding CsgD family transcriptional regulator